MSGCCGYHWARVPKPEDQAKAMSHVMQDIVAELGDVEVCELKRDLDPRGVCYATTHKARVKQRATGVLFDVVFYDMRGTMVEIEAVER